MALFSPAFVVIRSAIPASSLPLDYRWFAGHLGRRRGVVPSNARPPRRLA
jgi:hypothetical protein